jgi:stage V sporulation protein R
MKPIVEVVRKTSLFFQPQIRTKILNEGWASYWHEKLFLQDDRISGHEADFAQTTPRHRHAWCRTLCTRHAAVPPHRRPGREGKYSIDFRRLTDRRERALRPPDRQRRSSCSRSAKPERFSIHQHLCRAGLLDRFRLLWSSLEPGPGFEIYIRRSSMITRHAVRMLYHPPWIEIDGLGRNGI